MVDELVFTTALESSVSVDVVIPVAVFVSTVLVGESLDGFDAAVQKFGLARREILPPPE